MAKMSLREWINSQQKAKGISTSEAKKDAGKYKSISAAKKAGSLYYTDKSGKTKIAAYASDLTKSDKVTPLKKSLRPKARPASDVKGFTPEPVKVSSLVQGGRGDGKKEVIKRNIRRISESKKTTDKASNASSAARKRGQVPELKGAAWMKKNTFEDYMNLTKAEARALGLPATRISAMQHPLRDQKFKDGKAFNSAIAKKPSPGRGGKR